MDPTLFERAGVAMVGWLLLIVPGWRVTRWLAETALIAVPAATAQALLGLQPTRLPCR